jgi:hypothetical protein
MPYLHSPGLAAACLSVCEDGSIEATDHCADYRQCDFLVDLDLLRGGSEDAVEGEVILVLVNLLIGGGTASVSSLLLKETHSSPLLASSILLSGRRRQTTRMESWDIG